MRSQCQQPQTFHSNTENSAPNGNIAPESLNTSQIFQYKHISGPFRVVFYFTGNGVFLKNVINVLYII